MKRVYITAALTALAVLVAYSLYNPFWRDDKRMETVKVGFIYEGDGSIPDSYNFAMAQNALQMQYPNAVETLSRNNVLSDETEETLREFARKDCDIIFTNVVSDQVAAVARDYPDTQFCQVSEEEDDDETPDNYHTFNGEIYQARYVSGIAAGLKLRSLIDEGIIEPDGAVVGFVGSYPSAEVISGYTAFLLGARSVAPETVMRVRYTESVDNFTLEKKCAAELIDEGCVIIAQHTRTIGPAVACEEAATRSVYHIGYNQNMIDVAPTTSIVSIRVNWAPYVVGAVEAVMNRRTIEEYVDGNVHEGNDMSAGFERDWVQLLELNEFVASEDTQKRLDSVIEDFRKGNVQVFSGDYVGVDPFNQFDTYDLNKGYVENRDSSLPSFHYVLKDVIAVDE